MGTFVAVIAAAVVFGCGAYWAVQQEKKRTAALQSLAERQGWAFQHRPPLAVVGHPTRWHLFTAGRGKQVRNHAAGTRDGRQVAVFDYTYTTGGGRSQQTWRQTVVHVRVPGLELPGFELRPEHVFHKIGGMFGYQDIDVENDPAFSGQYLLRGADEAAIRALFDADVRDFYDRNPKCCTEAAGADLFVWRTGKVLKPQDVPALIDAAMDVAGRLARRAGASA